MLGIYQINRWFIQSYHYFFQICLQSTNEGLTNENNVMKLKLQGLENQYKLMNGMFFSFLTYQVTYLMFLWWRIMENGDHYCSMQANTHNLFMHEVSWRWMMTYRFLIVNLYHMFMFFPSWLYEVCTLGSICYTQHVSCFFTIYISHEICAYH